MGRERKKKDRQRDRKTDRQKDRKTNKHINKQIKVILKLCSTASQTSSVYSQNKWKENNVSFTVFNSAPYKVKCLSPNGGSGRLEGG